MEPFKVEVIKGLWFLYGKAAQPQIGGDARLMFLKAEVFKYLHGCFYTVRRHVLGLSEMCELLCRAWKSKT